MIRTTTVLLWFVLALSAIAAEQGTPVVAKLDDYSKLAANTWTVVHVEDNSGGKWGARVIHAIREDRLYLWGIGGKRPERNRYLRYELESFDPLKATWIEALPTAKAGAWSGGKHPPFVIYGQSGPAEGPAFRSVGNQSFNQVTFHEFDGVVRPSPLLIFNQACYDSKRDRAVFFAGGHTFALDPTTNAWTDLKPQVRPAAASKSRLGLRPDQIGTESQPTRSSPIACQQLAWASLAYDPVNDELLLFGGGDALNVDGGACTWLYCCETNTWRRARPGSVLKRSTHCSHRRQTVENAASTGRLTPNQHALASVATALKLCPEIEPPLRCTSPIVFDPVVVVVAERRTAQGLALNRCQ